MNKKNIVFGGIVLLGVVAGVFFLRIQQKQKLDTNKMSGCEKTGGVWQNEECACPSLFSNFNTTRFRCEDSFGNSPASREEALRFEKRTNFVGECASGQKEVYVVAGTPFTFCYPAVWGGVQLNEKAGVTSLTFPRPQTGGAEVPQMSFGIDFEQRLGERGSEQLLGGYRVRSQENRGNVTLFVENVFSDYNFVISGSVKIRQEMESLVESLWYDDLAG